MRRWAILLGVTAFLLVLGACGPVKMPPDVREPASTRGSQEPPDTSAIDALTPAEKRSAIAESFPAEVPVPKGEFVRAAAQGSDAWHYEVKVEAMPAAVVSWYRESYIGRQWVLLNTGEFDGPSGRGTFLDFRKNNAESSVRVFVDDSDNVARVKVTVGVGTPVLGAQ